MFTETGLLKAIREKDIEKISGLFFNKQQKSVNPNYRANCKMGFQEPHNA
jgi:hypothetical protein